MKRTLLAFFIFTFAALNCNTAKADIFGPRPEKRLTASQGVSIDPGTILADATQIAGYLGTREGVFYDFNAGEVCNYAAATIYTYQPYGIALDAGALNMDGFAVTVDWNAGANVPSDQVPLLNLVKYLYVGGGVGARDLDKSDTDSTKTWRVAYGVDAQLKFTF